ncbi:FMN-dependent NADH-azoreductase [Halomonas sp. HL-93]|uniref:FMN-dependent NADH-azoreductase n=1 Tax=Halomonas sp. HL-93 TaxID=1666906 RepID=UPI0006DB1C19|nr:FMN-dependent NADH-azoreductase [Halomonas sp. HL-93]KPQ24515.1 MAG: FMN-dependent NADH-azoreductase [Halomonas sp. HL-93]SBR48379.1 FMN-dependent NADH-azoreductase [Halomonas sp. HL-93]
MSTLLKIQSSIFNNHGQSSALATRFTDEWLTKNPDGQVVTRDLTKDPVPHLTLDSFQAFITSPDEMTEEQHQVVAYSDALIEEVKNADVIVLGVPMYNFNVPSVLHAYFDHIARAGVTFRYTENGPEGLITGKKAYVFISRGGIYGEDHSQTRFLREILGFIGITDVEFVHAEGLALNDSHKAESLTAAENCIGHLLSA